jgi:hypothetical protein
MLNQPISLWTREENYWTIRICVTGERKDGWIIYTYD